MVFISRGSLSRGPDNTKLTVEFEVVIPCFSEFFLQGIRFRTLLKPTNRLKAYTNIHNPYLVLLRKPNVFLRLREFLHRSPLACQFRFHGVVSSEVVQPFYTSNMYSSIHCI